MATDPNMTQRILAAINAIRRGRVASYGDIARRAGLPGRARMVARLLSSGGHGDLPWHRVVRSDGRIAFAAGSCAWREQVRRLRAEGVTVVHGRVRGQRPVASMDEQFWGPNG